MFVNRAGESADNTEWIVDSVRCVKGTGNRRGLFNAGMTFAGIHGYTQMLESFSDEPLAYVIGGLAAIPLAFGLWRLNNVWFQPLDVAGTR